MIGYGKRFLKSALKTNMATSLSNDLVANLEEDLHKLPTRDNRKDAHELIAKGNGVKAHFLRIKGFADFLILSFFKT